MTDAVQTNTLRQLVEDTADRIGDIHRVEAASGSVNTLVDPINLPFASKDYTRCQMIFTSGSNANTIVLITHTDNKEHKLTFEPDAGTAVADGDTAFIVNIGGVGFSFLDYKAQINRAIRELDNLARPVIEYNASAAFSVDSPTLTLPTTIDEVSRVYLIDSEGVERTIPNAAQTGYEGWEARLQDGELVLNGYWASRADGYAVWVIGEGRHGELASWTSTTTINPRYLTARAASRLMERGLKNDTTGAFARLILKLDQEAEALVSSVRDRRSPSSRRVRQ